MDSGSFCSKQNLILVGFMGSGKTTVGRLLAQERGLFLLDTDMLIESKVGYQIAQIFARFGEPYFRNLEKELFQWLKTSVRGAVVATGGGLPIHCENINQAGKVFYLQMEFEQILQRLSQDECDKRPLFQDIERTRILFQARIPIYEACADAMIDASLDSADIVQQILEIVD
ncbi:shikimate kinase [Helicobacter monodelphidis]|uniref:shikimate kinase n=1 Tax=Helicobacter sp. 15-1451 TaxID=2004995 RepID=UPI0015EBC7E6|nr:shikimate kinase [Helicobacter sp. 15-1451]